MLKKILSAFLFCCGIYTYGQENTYFLSILKDTTAWESKQPKLDSLLALYKARNIDSLTHVYNNYAYFLYDENEISKAISYNETALELATARVPKDTTFLKISRFNLGFYYRKNNQYQKSIPQYEKIINYGLNDELTIRSYFALGLVYIKTGDFYKAFEYFEEVTQKFSRLNIGNELLLQTYMNLTYISFEIKTGKMLEKGAYYGHKADSLANIMGVSKEVEMEIKFTIGVLHAEKQYLDTLKTISHYKQTLKLAKKLNNNEFTVKAYEGLADLYNILDTKKSVFYYQKALQKVDTTDVNQTGSLYNGLGHTYRISEDYQKSFKNRHRSLFILTGNDFKDISSVPINFLLQYENKEVLFHILPQLAETYLSFYERQSGSEEDLERSIAYFKMADTLLDDIRKNSTTFKSRLFWRTVSKNLYSKAIRACFLKKDIELLFYFMEKNKALLLLEDLYTAKQNHVFKESQKDSSLFVLKPTIRDLKKVQGDLKQDESVLLYHLSQNLDYSLEDSNKAYGLYITQNSTVPFEIKDRNSLQIDVKKLLVQLNTPFKVKEDLDHFRDLSFSIYQRLFPADKIPFALENKKLTIIPDGILALLPFESLITSTKEDTYLLEKCTLSYAHSNSFLHEISQEKISGEVLGIAPVEFDSLKLSLLSNSSLEIDALLEHYNGMEFLEKAATKQAFSNNSTNRSIIHLATHADAKEDSDPWIAFSDAKMELEELYEQKVKADLVVLSGCNTGIGENAEGEGIMNLARGFFYSGSKSIISSTWNINDKATAEILANFYKYLSEGSTKSVALRMAKLAYIKNHRGADASPYYWAPLVLWGVDDTLPSQKRSLWPYLFLLTLPIIYFGVKHYRKAA